MTSTGKSQVSVMLAVDDAPAALAWYKRALGAKVLWHLGSVVGMEIDGAPIFLGQPENKRLGDADETRSVVGQD